MQQRRAVEQFFVAGVASGVTQLFSCPLFNIKMLLQTQNELLRSGVIDRPYNGIIDCTQRTISSDGFTALWAGDIITIFRYFPSQAINFTFKDYFRRFVPAKQKSYFSWFVGNTLSGTAAGAISLLLLYPLDLIRTKLICNLTNPAGLRQYSGIIDLLEQTAASDGITGFYRGFGISVLGIAVYRGLYFGLFDLLNHFIPIDRNRVVLRVLLGYGVTITAGLLSYPIDTIRRRMMLAPSNQIDFHSAYSCARYIMENEGFLAFFDGAFLNILRSVAGTAALIGYDICRGHLRGKFN